MNEEEIKAEMRVYVLEVMVANLLAMVCMQMQPLDPGGAVKAIADQMKGGARQQTFSALGDAAMSDLFSAELESAATRLADMASEQIALVLRAQAKMKS